MHGLWGQAALNPPPSVVSIQQTVLMNFVKAGPNIWSSDLLVPAYAAVASMAALLIHRVLLSKAVHRVLARIPSRGKYEPLDDDDDVPVEQPVTMPREGVMSDLRVHIQFMGGPRIFFYKVLRLIGCLALVGLTIATLVLDEKERDGSGLMDLLKKRKKHKGKKKPSHSDSFTNDEWLQVALLLTYTYASFLALVAVTASHWWRRIANTHLVLLLLVICGVFAVRDIWPLGTFTMEPADIAEGWLMWTKLAVLSVTALVIPLLLPRPYVPVDPKDPALEPNLEQTTPLLSLVLYTFLDSIIFKAYRIPHLPADEFPPLADYDYASNLVKRSFKHIDVFSGAKKSHIFFGLMRTFYAEYVGIAIMTVLRVFSMYAGPIGINRLLNYLETGGEGAIVRPWVWVSWLFFGPVIGTLVWQWYIFLTTGTLVRTEGIITQLVFSHALRIRMKAATPAGTKVPPADGRDSSSAGSSRPQTPDNASVAGSTDGSTVNGGNGLSVVASTSGSTAGGESTLRASTASVQSVQSGKGKGKGNSSASSIASKNGGDGKDGAKDSHSSTDNLVGKLNNLVTTDLNNIVEGRDFMLVLVYSPLMIGLGVWFLYEILGWSALIGMVVMILSFPLPGYIAKVIQSVQIARMKKTDARVQVVTEIMNVIRMIKLFGWEPKVRDQIAEKRDEELVYIRNRQLLDLLNGTINFLIPLLTMIATFVTYTVIMKKELSASRVYSSMAVFDMLRDQLHMVFYLIPAAIQAKVSLDRVHEFLHETELLDEFDHMKKEGPVEVLTYRPDDSDLIGFRNATFSWSIDTDGTLTPSRRNYRLRVEDELLFKRGAINLIIGPTGSGKTSMLMALLGEMHFLPSEPTSWFNLPRDKGVAYAAQESWVQNETIRDNILFGAPYDEARYKKVISQCGLGRDLELFEAGDKTEVGEKGLTLSGGQKARVTLARAVYSNADILLLDDVLAALDVHTARWIIDNCLRGELIRGRTVILVTHNVAMASPIADFVVALGTDGRVTSKGSVADALKRDKKLRAALEKEKVIEEKAEEVVDEQGPAEDKKKSDGKLMVAEEIAEGHVRWPAIKLYLTNLGGPLFWILFLGGIFLCDLLNVLQTWFLGFWASQYEDRAKEDVSVGAYMSIFGLMVLGGCITYCGAYLLYTFGSIRASRTIHRRLMESITGTTLRWLDSTPTGRVIARCTQDIRAIDGPVSQNLGWLCELTLTLMMRFAAVVVITPVFVIPGIVIGAIGYWCGQVYIKAQLSVKREMSNARSPVLSHFGAAIAGLISIRAFGAQNSFKNESMNRINRYTRSARTFYNLNRWVCVRIDALGGFFAAGLAAYLIYGPAQHRASNIGFSLNMAVAFSSMILWWVRILNEFEVSGNSLERIQDYVTIEQEPKPTPDGVPPAYWPASGDLRVEGLSARYSVGGPKVLHDLTFDVKSGERVGIVGRTGSGKSSLTLSLLRCIITEGKVYYDSLPTDSINLDILRRNITIIPQVPELLSGTLRHNLDPFDENDDATLNDALRSAGLFSLQKVDDENKITLDSAIASGGTNLSVGQRQILALARAIVRGSKLLILDEATSAIDYETDSVIQSSLRHELGGDVTLLTVAHRLQTIMDSDRILVLDAGRIVEFDTPQNLLKKQGGLLKALVDESGDKDTLYAMAEGKANV